jgi:nucleoside-diphosphate-sugar epimerase
VRRRYLITGAQGFVGRYLTARILEVEKDAEVVGIGRSSCIDGFFTHPISTRRGRRPAPLPAETLARFTGRYHYERISLLDTPRLRAVIRDYRPHSIFHLASALHTASDRDLIETNVAGTSSLMDAVSKAQGGAARVILGSSGSTYGEPASLPIREGDPCNPADMYGVTKLSAEHITRIRAERSGFAFVIARIFNIVGPGQSEEHVCARFAAQLASSATSRRPKVEVGALETTRDFIDVRDVAAALLLIAQREECGGTYNLASGRETPIQFVLSELIRVSGGIGQVEIAEKNRRSAGVRRHFGDVSRLQRLSFAPKYSISESLHDLFRYYQQLYDESGTHGTPKATMVTTGESGPGLASSRERP